MEAEVTLNNGIITADEVELEDQSQVMTRPGSGTRKVATDSDEKTPAQRLVASIGCPAQYGAEAVGRCQ